MSNPRFKSKFSDVQLLDAAIEVIEYMRENGTAESQRRFDDVRANAGWPELPRADSICSRLGISWVKLCEMPGRTASGRAIALGKRGTWEPNADWVTDDQIKFALHLAAHRIGAATITSADYRRERAKVLRDGCSGSVLPDEEQILQKAGSWRAALAISEMPFDDPLERELERFVGVSSVLDRALEAHGVIPTQTELFTFVGANDLTLPDRITPYREVIEEWRLHRLNRGLQTPEYAPGGTGRPDFTRRVIWERSRRIRRGYWTEERATAAVARFLASRAGGEPTTRKAYVDWSKGNRDAPSAAYLDRWFGGFSRIRQLAKARKS